MVPRGFQWNRIFNLAMTTWHRLRGAEELPSIPVVALEDSRNHRLCIFEPSGLGIQRRKIDKVLRQRLPTKLSWFLAVSGRIRHGVLGIFQAAEAVGGWLSFILTRAILAVDLKSPAILFA
jgi:hypothetical protein